MIFVFNRDAIRVALIALLLLLPIALLWWLNVIKEESVFLPGSWALFAASLIASKRNLRGRLFYIFPTWIVTLSCAIYTSYHFFDGVVSVVKFGLIIFLLLVTLLVVFLFLHERRQIKKLHIKLLELPDKSSGMLHYWNDIKNLFFFPLFNKWTESMCEYNIRVLEFLKENDIDLRFSEEFCSNLMETKSNISNGGNQKPDIKIREAFVSEIDHQIKIWK